MMNSKIKTVDSQNPSEQKIVLEQAYAQSASEDRLVAKEFDAALGDGLVSEDALNAK